MLRGLWALVLPAVFVVAACGGGGSEPSENDLRTVQAMLSSTANVQRAVQPLYTCAPRDRACYEAAGGEIVETVAREQASFDAFLEQADSDCLKEVGGLFRNSLDAYAEAGRAAAAGETKAADQAISRSSTAEIAYIRRMDDCGFSQGETAAIEADMRRVNVDILALIEEIETCKERACVVDVAQRLQAAARRGVQAVDGYLGAIGDDVPECVPDGLDLMRRAFESLELAGAAIEQGDFATAQREGTASDELRIQAQEKLAACIGSAL